MISLYNNKMYSYKENSNHDEFAGKSGDPRSVFSRTPPQFRARLPSFGFDKNMAEIDSAVEKMEETDETVREGGDEQGNTGSTVTASEQQPDVETVGSLGQW